MEVDAQDVVNELLDRIRALTLEISVLRVSTKKPPPPDYKEGAG